VLRMAFIRGRVVILSKIGLEDQNNCKDRINPDRMLTGKKMLAKIIKAVIQEVAKECHYS